MPNLAERKMGEMLMETERANAARDKKKAESPTVIPPPTLEQLGISPPARSAISVITEMS